MRWVQNLTNIGQHQKGCSMIYSFEASMKPNSTTQILAGTIREVQEGNVIVTVPVGYNNIKDYQIASSSLAAFGKLSVGMPIVAIGIDCADGTFEVNAEKQKMLAPHALQFMEFDRAKTNITTKKKSMEHDVLMVFPLAKSSQVIINEEKNSVTIPANVDNVTVWLRFCQNKFSHFENYEAEGKKHLGIKAYAEMLKKRMDSLAEGDVLLIPYTGRFEDSLKDEATGKYTYVPATPQEKDGKLIYSIFGNGENALGTMLNTSMEVAKTFIPMTKNGLPAKEQEQVQESINTESQTELSEEEELRLLSAMG